MAHAFLDTYTRKCSTGLPLDNKQNVFFLVLLGTSTLKHEYMYTRQACRINLIQSNILFWEVHVHV